jgi:hypothetical protein
LEVLSLIRFRRNMLVPINRLPPDVLVLIPHYWSAHEREENVIALTHVCRTWREIFISRASLWTDFRCADSEKTRVYLERSRSAPINVWLERRLGLFPNDPFLEIVPHTISRLKYLSVKTTSGHFQDIIRYLFHPAPLLEVLAINGNHLNWLRGPVLPTEIFEGDLSSLRELRLHSVQTIFPWRNMNNLASFSLYSCGSTASVEQLLDFFESSPRLTEVKLFFTGPTQGVGDGRLVGLAHLKRLSVSGIQPPHLLLDHLIVPVGANVSTIFRSPGPCIEDHLPRSLDNLRNFTHFTEIHLLYQPELASVRFTGPNGQVCIASSSPGPDAERIVPRSLAPLDTSKTRYLEITNCTLTTELHEVLASLTDLHTLIISRCRDTFAFLLGLMLTFSPNGSVVCPKLEELVFRTSKDFDMEAMAEVAAERASEGAPLKLVKVVSFGEPVPMEGVEKLLEHVSHVETSVEDEEEEEEEDEDEEDTDEEW